MSTSPILDQLQALGTEQARKTYRRHGVTGDRFGVSYADLKALKKKLRVDHALALQLWSSGIHEARLLALMIADPQQTDSALLDAWVGDLKDYPLSDAFAQFVAETPLAREKMAHWVQSDDEWIGSTGWNILGRLADSDADLPDHYFEPYLATIQGTIHRQKNRVRHSMNSALIGIGGRNPALEEKALAVAAAIGKVVVDHGDTSCKTPDATACIRKVRARQQVGA